MMVEGTGFIDLPRLCPNQKSQYYRRLAVMHTAMGFSLLFFSNYEYLTQGLSASRMRCQISAIVALTWRALMLLGSELIHLGHRGVVLQYPHTIS
jgi:hypothetical protein